MFHLLINGRKGKEEKMQTGLYELSNWLLKLEAQIEEAELLDVEAAQIEGLQAAYDAVGDLTKEQIVEAAYAVRNYQAAQLSLKSEEEKLRRKREAYRSREEGLRDKMLYSLNILGEKKVSDDVFRIMVASKPGELVLDVSEDAIPDEFFKVERSLKRGELKKAVKRGDTTYAHIGESGQCLKIM